MILVVVSYLPLILDRRNRNVRSHEPFRELEVIKDFQSNPKEASKNLLRKAKMQLALRQFGFLFS